MLNEGSAGPVTELPCRGSCAKEPHFTGYQKQQAEQILLGLLAFGLSSQVRCTEHFLFKTVRSVRYLPFFAVFLPAAALVDFFAGASFFVVAIFWNSFEMGAETVTATSGTLR